MDNATRKQLLQRHRMSGFPGSILDVFRAHDQGVDLIGQFEQQQQQQNMQVASTPQEQGQGLRPAHQAGNVSQSMVFPNVPPNTPFNTKGMKAPINIRKYDEQGHLVKSYENVPPGISSLPTGPQRGTVIETPANMQSGGGVLAALGNPALTGPLMIRGLVQEGKRRIADNLFPSGYASESQNKLPEQRLYDALILNQPEPSSRADLGPRPENPSRRYLSLEERGNLLGYAMGQNDNLPPADYKPSDAQDTDAVYFKSPTTEQNLIEKLQSEEDALKWINRQTADGDGGIDYHTGVDLNVLGNYTLDKGQDDKGHYISYYDIWDLDPFKDKTRKVVSDAVQSIAGVRSPEVYGRIYYDPETGKPITEPITEKKQTGGAKEDYNMARAQELGYKPDSTGHMPSVDDRTGDYLKSKKHPTAWKEYLHSQLSLDPFFRENTTVADPKGYFGENQLKYVPRKKQQGGGFKVEGNTTIQSSQPTNPGFLRPKFTQDFSEDVTVTQDDGQVTRNQAFETTRGNRVRGNQTFSITDPQGNVTTQIDKYRNSRMMGLIPPRSTSKIIYPKQNQQAGGPRKFQASGATGRNYLPLNSSVAESTRNDIFVPDFEELQAAKNLQEIREQEELMERLQAPEGEIKPAGRGAPPNAMAFMPPGLQYNQQAAGKYIEENPLSNPVSLTALGSFAALAGPTAAETRGGQILGKALNSKPVRYGFGAHSAYDLSNIRNWEGTGQENMERLGTNVLGLAGIAPEAAKLKSAFGSLYKVNPYLKNPMGFRNVGDKPHFLFGYNKPIDPMRMDLNPEAGFKQFLGERDLLYQGMLQGRMKSSAMLKKEAELLAKTPFGESIGSGSFGSVHPFLDNSDYVLKMGKGSIGRAGSYQQGRYSGITDEFLERTSQLSHLDNVAIPLRTNTIPLSKYGPRFRYQKTMPDGNVRNVNIQPRIPETELTVMKAVDGSGDIAGGTSPLISNPATKLPTRDQFAATLKKVRQMRDKGIGIDIDNPRNITFNRNTGDFNLYDLENVPQLAAKNPAEFEALQNLHGPMHPYKDQFNIMSPSARTDVAYSNPSDYMFQVRNLLGRQGAGIPNKSGRRLIDNFKKGGFKRKYQSAGARRVLTMGLPQRSSIVSDMATDDPAGFADLAGTDFNMEWNNSPMAKKMLQNSYMKQAANDPLRSTIAKGFNLPTALLGIHQGGLGDVLTKAAANRAANNTIEERNKNLLNASYLPTPTMQDFEEAYGEPAGDDLNRTRAFYSPEREITVYNPNVAESVTPRLLGTGVHERSHVADKGRFPLEDLNMMRDFKESDPKLVRSTEDSYREYVQEPTETRARLMAMRRALSARGVDIFNSPVSEKDTRYLQTVPAFQELRTGYTRENILKMLNSIAYEKDNNLPENVAKRGGKRPTRKYFKLRK